MSGDNVVRFPFRPRTIVGADQQFGACLDDLPRRFTVRLSTPAEADAFSGCREPDDQAVTVIDHNTGDSIFVPAAPGIVVEDTDQCGLALLKAMGERAARRAPDGEIPF